MQCLFAKKKKKKKWDEMPQINHLRRETRLHFSNAEQSMQSNEPYQHKTSAFAEKNDTCARFTGEKKKNARCYANEDAE